MKNENATHAPTLSPVQFHEDVIYSIEYDGQPFTPVKPIIENIGIDWSGQAAKLRNNKQRWGVEIISIPSKSGDQEYVCIPVRKLPGFLATINPVKVKNSLRSKIVQYQNECDDVLWDYWTKGQATNPRVRAKSSPLSDDHISQVEDAINNRFRFWNPERHDLGREQFYKAINNEFQVGRYQDIPLDKFDELMDFITVDCPQSHGVFCDVENHKPNIIDDLLQFVLYRIDGIADDISGVGGVTRTRNIVLELTRITAALGAVFPEEMQWLYLSRQKEKRPQIEYNPEIAPKIAAYDQFMNSDGLYTLRGAFKALGLKPNLHTAKLRDDGILYKLQDNNVPYQTYLDKKYFEVKMKPVERDGKEPKEYPQTYVTPKGLDWLREKYCTETA